MWRILSQIWERKCFMWSDIYRIRWLDFYSFYNKIFFNYVFSHKFIFWNNKNNINCFFWNFNDVWFNVNTWKNSFCSDLTTFVKSSSSFALTSSSPTSKYSSTKTTSSIKSSTSVPDSNSLACCLKLSTINLFIIVLCNYIFNLIKM